LNDRTHCLNDSANEENSSCNNRDYGPRVIEIILFQGCRPFVFPLSVVLVLGVVLVQILNYISKVEIVDVDKIFLGKIAEKA